MSERGGVSEYAPPPLVDSDGDGLPDRCEDAVFGTDPLKPDSDQDGVDDGSEDHDDNGLSNRGEQFFSGPSHCGEIGTGDDSVARPREGVTAAQLTDDDSVASPREGVTAAQLADEADGQYRSGRLSDAVVTYKQALMLNSDCQICPLRIETINKEIKRKVLQNFSDGLRYQATLQYQEAQQSFSAVMELTKPSSVLHLQAQQAYKEVTAAMQR